jgi:hypothetical protein
MIAVMILAGFFSMLYELNGVCLRFINASKENMGALEGVHDRLESLRGLNFSDLTTQSYVTTLVTSPANSSPIAQKVTETVTLRAYPVVSGGPMITYTRAPGASSAPSVSSSGGSIASGGIVRADVTYAWNLTLGGRSQTESSSTLIADGVKK